MEGRGNFYQSLINSAKCFLDDKTRLPNDLAEFAAFCGENKDEVRAVFPTVDDLREALIYQAVTLINDTIRAQVVDSDPRDPIAQLHAVGHGYLEWAETNSALFGLLATSLNQKINPGSTLHRYTSSMRDLYHRKLSEAQRVGMISADVDIEISTMMLHCLVKGGNMMFMTRDKDPWFEDDPRSTRVLAECIFDQFLSNLVNFGKIRT